MGDHNGAIAAAAITAVGGVVAALIGAGVIGGDDDKGGGSPPTTTAARTSMSIPTLPIGRTSLFVNRDSGPGGSQVLLSGEGFAPNERVTFRLHTEQIGRTTANADGRFSNVAVTIPRTFSAFAPQQFAIHAEGESPMNRADTPFTITG